MSSVDILIVGGHEIDRARLADVCEQFGVVELALFGSVGRGEESSASDVDLLYVGAEVPGVTQVGRTVMEETECLKPLGNLSRDS